MFKEIKEKLLEEYKDKSKYYNYCYDKAEVLSKNTKKHKLELTAGITLASIITVFIAGGSLLEGMPISSISMTLTFASITGVSLGIGYLGQKLITLNAKRRMRTFTTAYKNKEIVKELADYEIEKVQIEKKLQIIDAILDKAESKEKILDEITRDGKYKITENTLSEEELNKNYELMLQNYNSKMEDLDILVSQNFLRKKFRDYRKKWDRVPNAISNGLVVALLLSFPADMGYLGDELRKQIPTESMSDFIKQIFSAFIPMIPIAPITILSSIRRSNDNLYAFNELNNMLGKNALEQKPNKIKEEYLEQNIEKLTNELVELGYSIKEAEYMLKEMSLQRSTEEKEQSLGKHVENTWEDTLISEEDVKLSIQESPAPFNPETVFGEDESLEKKTGKKLVRTIKTNNTNNNK